MNKTLKLHFQGDLGVGSLEEIKEEEKLILDFLAETRYPRGREYRLMCGDPVTIDVDFEVPEEPQIIRTLGDVKALFPHSVNDSVD